MSNIPRLLRELKDRLAIGLKESETSMSIQKIDFHGSHGCEVNVVVIDVSGSMDDRDYKPTRLDGAKKAFNHFLDALKVRNQIAMVGLVEFSSKARLVFPPLPLSGNITKMRKAAQELSTISSTNIGAGLLVAAKTISKIQIRGNPQIILLSDGHSNTGRNPKKVARKIKSAGIQLDIIGIGGSPEEVNEPELKKMASVVNGELRYWFIETVPELVKRFEALALREL